MVVRVGYRGGANLGVGVVLGAGMVHLWVQVWVLLNEFVFVGPDVLWMGVIN